MGIVLRQSVYTSIISYAGVVVGYINLLYLYPKFLEPDQVGLLRAIQDVAMLLLPFAAFGLAHGVAKFFPRYSKSQDQANSFVGLIISLSIASFIFFLIVILFFQDPMINFFSENAKEIIPYKNLIIGLTFVLMLITVFEQLSKSILKVVFPNFLSQIFVRILQGALVTLYFFSMLTFHEFIVSSVLIYILSLIVLIIFLFRNKITLSFKNLNQFSFQRIREILTFSSLSFVSASSMILISKMDSIMVTGLLGLSEVAVYTTAFYMATVIEIPKRAITQTTAVLISQSFEQNDMQRVLSLYQKASLHQFIIGALLMIGIWANLENIYQVMPKGDFYEAGSTVVILIGFAKLIDMAFGPNSEVIGFSRHYWFNVVSIILLAVIVMVCNYLLIPEFGINGAAYGTVFAIVVFNAIRLFFIYVKLGMQPFTRETLIVLAIGVSVSLLNFILPRSSNVFIDILYRSAVITSVFSVLIIASKCSPEINNVYWKILRRTGLKK